MEPNIPNNDEKDPFDRWLAKWAHFQPAPPRREGYKTVCWLAGFGAFLHPFFAYLPAKWPLFVMDGFLVLIIVTVLWHERNDRKE